MYKSLINTLPSTLLIMVNDFSQSFNAEHAKPPLEAHNAARKKKKKEGRGPHDVNVVWPPNSGMGEGKEKECGVWMLLEAKGELSTLAATLGMWLHGGVTFQFLLSLLIINLKNTCGGPLPRQHFTTCSA